MTSFSVEKIHEDKRGEMFVGKIGDNEVLIMHSVKGAPRGGHFHDSEQIHCVMHGSFEYREYDPKTGKEIKKILRAGDSVKIPAGNTHLLIALEESILVEVKKSDTQTKDFPEWRKIVQDYMNRV